MEASALYISHSCFEGVSGEEFVSAGSITELGYGYL